MAYNQVLKTTLISKLSENKSEIWAPDDSRIGNFNTRFIAPEYQQGRDQRTGSDAPYVMINQVPISNSIESLIIDETGKIPTIRIIFEDVEGAISGPNYPANNPILSVYIKSGNEKYAAISADFIITSIKSDLDNVANPDAVGIYPTYIMSGELYVPKMYNNFSKSYSNLSSKEAMRSLAQDLDLGFTELDIETNDNMTWINPNRDGSWFMDHIAKHAYSSEDSFWDVFIDRYYNITFLDVSNQLVEIPVGDVEKAFLDAPNSSEINPNKSLQDTEDDNDFYSNFTYLMLTNKDQLKGSSNYITNFLLEGDLGRILKNKGFRKKVYYYDHISEEDKKISYWINSSVIKGKSENSRLVPNDSTLRSNLVKKWINIDYGNTHREWNSAAIQNDHNLSELKKINLRVETSGVNFAIARGFAVPVTIFKSLIQASRQEVFTTDGTNPEEAQKEEGFEFEDDPLSITIDQYLTGTYYVSGTKIIYDKFEPTRFRTEFILSRINWTVEKNRENDAP